MSPPTRAPVHKPLGSTGRAAHGWVKDANAPERITGRKLQRLRLELMRRQPLCAECTKRGVVRPTTQRDHIVPLAQGGTEDDSNIQGLCDDCHDAKSKGEAKRGRWG